MSEWISQSMIEAAAKAIKDEFRHPDMNTDGQFLRAAWAALKAALFVSHEEDAKREMAKAADRAHLHNLGSMVEHQVAQIETQKAQLDRWLLYRKAQHIPQTAVEAAADVLAGCEFPGETRLADAIAAAIGVLCLHVPLQVALTDALTE